MVLVTACITLTLQEYIGDRIYFEQLYPYDRKNLNRVFPGRPDGTQAERIAWQLTTALLGRKTRHRPHYGGGQQCIHSFFPSSGSADLSKSASILLRGIATTCPSMIVIRVPSIIVIALS